MYFPELDCRKNKERSQPHIPATRQSQDTESPVLLSFGNLLSGEHEKQRLKKIAVRKLSFGL
jgi:hypothetical protein